MKVHRENLMSALYQAIKTRRADEKQQGFTGDSGMVAGWNELYKALGEGEQVEFIGEEKPS